MASNKRKLVTDDRPNKKAKSTSKVAATKPSKLSKPRNAALSERKPTAKPSKPRDADSSERRPAAKSVLQQEEKAFPRGGAGVLTPLEHKQIKAQAEEDALFEQESGHAIDGRDETLFEDGATSVPARKKQKKRRSSNGVSSAPEKSAIKIQGLSYKSLTVGSVVLGYVTAITDRDVAIALANNLTGYLPITAVSERLNARIEKLLEREEAAKPSEDADEDVDLKQVFHVGQWLRATVTATSSDPTDSSGKSKKHIELTVDPSKVNGNLESSNIVTKSMIQASVRSVEDHGIVMDLGLSDRDVKGFVSKKELGSAYKLDDVQEGQVMMCLVTGKGSNGKVLKLCPDAARFAVVAANKNAPFVSEAPTVEAFQPGTAVDVLVVESGSGGIAAKIMGMLDVTADIVHSNASNQAEDITQKYKIASKTKARIIWTTSKDDGSRRIGISLLDNLLTLPPASSRLPENASAKLRTQAGQLEHHLPLSSTVEDANITRVLADRGLFLTLPGQQGRTAKAFAHISQVSDTRIDTLSSTTGKHQLDSTHKVRIISFNPIDNTYYVSLKQSILDQAFLRIEDLTIGEVVKGTVDKLVLGAKGITGALVKLSDSITGLVPEIHLSDVHLQHPERKFKDGTPVRARVLSVDFEKRHVRLTLKKSLVSEGDSTPIWKDYTQLEPGIESKGTIVNLLPAGAAVQFYGNVRAWLPVAEMSDTFIDVPEKHFRLGQTVSVRVVSIDANAQEMKVSCKDSGDLDPAQQQAWEDIAGGEIISGTVTEKAADSVTVELENGLKGLIRAGHLTDGSATKAEAAFRKLHVGKKLSELVVLYKLERSRHVLLTKKASMIEEAKAGTLIRSFQDVKQGQKVHGFVRNVTLEGTYCEFADGAVGLLPKSQILPELYTQPAFGFVKDQTMSVWVMGMDISRQRFTLSMREQKDAPSTKATTQVAQAPSVANAADSSISSMADFTLGKVTKARIASVKATQINVRLADNVQGRIDVSEVFDSWEEITNKKAPLQKFKPNETLEVKILGIHDARSHRFLPFSHRQGGAPVFELSAKSSRVTEASEGGLTMDSVKSGSSHLAFVNNYGDNCVWVNISPNVRGRVALMDLSHDAGQLQHLTRHFPIGCALRVTVKAVNPMENKLDLIARTGSIEEPLTLQTVSTGMIVAGRVTKITERSVTVQLSESLAAPVPLVELGDDYDQLNLSQYSKNDIVRVCILDVDLPDKKLFLSLRASKVLSSSLPVRDAQVANFAQLEPGHLVRGFVKHVGEKGVHVSLGTRVDALVRISDLSDQYIKDWQSVVEVDQLVQGRVISVDAPGRHALLSLKASHVEKDYKAPITINDLAPDTVVTGKVRQVEDFGAFIDIDNTQPRLSGLCHRSEVAAKRVEDVRKLYTAGDKVKAKVLSVDVEARKISLGLKASYFAEDEDGVDEDDDDHEGGDSENEAHGIELVQSDDDKDAEGGVEMELEDIQDLESDGDESSEVHAMGIRDEHRPTSGLKTNGFDWTGQNAESASNGAVSDSEPDLPASKKRKRHKPEIKVDMTGDVDRYGPRNASDFERQLLGQPNNSGLWIQYMAFQLRLSEVQKAREMAERALRTIHMREVEEKANVWIAWINLEVEYGDNEKVEEVFNEACQVQDSLEMHQKLASIYIDSGKHDKADTTFEKIVSNKASRASPEVWLNYANFLMDVRSDPLKARSLLSRALQSVAPNEHRILTAKFAALEFRSTKGNPERGRTIFEGLVAEWPKWSSGWDMLVDLERSRIPHVANEGARLEAVEKVRALFERMTSQKMKKRRAKFVFKRWLEFEEAEGNGKAAERVKALAKAYVEAQQSGIDEAMDE